MALFMVTFVENMMFWLSIYNVLKERTKLISLFRFLGSSYREAAELMRRQSLNSFLSLRTSTVLFSFVGWLFLFSCLNVALLEDAHLA